MTDYGFNKLALCEFLSCSPSELPKRCTELPDEHMIVAYLARKSELGSQEMSRVRRGV